MCCFVLCYFANTKIDESFRTAKIRRTFFGNSLASKFAGCVRKDDFGSGRFRKNRRRKRKTAQFRRTNRIFCYLCRAIRNSGLSWLVKKSGKFYSKQSSVYPALRCSLRRMARDMIPTSLRRGLYTLICFRVFQSLSPNKQTVVRVRIFTGAAQRSPKSTPP